MTQTTATVSVQLTLRTPTLPNFVEVEGFRHATLDDALAAGGKGLTLDVADLDAETLDCLIKQWGAALKLHAAARRGMRLGAKR